MAHRTLDEIIFRAEQLKLDFDLVVTLLHDLDEQRKNPDAVPPPPRPKAPRVETPQPGSPAPTTYGTHMDRAATVGQKNALRIRGKALGVTQEQIDAMAMRKFNKERWNMVTQGECVVLMRAIESGER